MLSIRQLKFLSKAQLAVVKYSRQGSDPFPNAFVAESSNTQHSEKPDQAGNVLRYKYSYMSMYSITNQD